MKKTILTFIFVFLFGACTTIIPDPVDFVLADGSYNMPNNRTFVVDNTTANPRISEGATVLYTYHSVINATQAVFVDATGAKFVGIQKNGTDTITLALYADAGDPDNTWTTANAVDFDPAHLYKTDVPEIDPFVLADGEYSMPNGRTFVVTTVNQKPAIGEKTTGGTPTPLYTYVAGLTADTARFKTATGDSFVGIQKNGTDTITLALYAKDGDPDNTWTTAETVSFDPAHLYVSVPVVDFVLTDGEYTMPNGRTFVVTKDANQKPAIGEKTTGGTPTPLYTYVAGLTVDTARFKTVTGDSFVGIKALTTSAPLSMELYAKDGNPDNKWTTANAVSFDSAHLYKTDVPVVDPFVLTDGEYTMPNGRTFVVTKDANQKPAIGEKTTGGTPTLLYTYVAGLTVDTARFKTVTGDSFVGIKALTTSAPLSMELYAKDGNPDNKWTTANAVDFDPAHLYKTTPDGDPNYVIPTTLLNPKFYLIFNSAGAMSEPDSQTSLALLVDKRIGRAVGSIKKNSTPPLLADIVPANPADITTTTTALKANVGALGLNPGSGGGTQESLPANRYAYIFPGTPATAFNATTGQISFSTGNGNTAHRYNFNPQKVINDKVGIGTIFRRSSGWAREGFTLMQISPTDSKDAFFHVRSFVDDNGVIVPDPVVANTDAAKWKERIDYLDGTVGSVGRLLTLGKKYTSATVEFDYSKFIKVFDPANTTASVARLVTYNTGEIVLANAKLNERSTLQFVKVIDNNHAIYRAGKRTVAGGPVVLLGEYLIIEIAGGDLIAHVKDVNTAGVVPTFWTTEAEAIKHYPNSKKRGSIVSGYTTAK